MYTTAWTDDEIADAGRPWAEFRTLHPERTYHAWRAKRGDIARGRVSEQRAEKNGGKVEPVVDGHELDESVSHLLEQSSDAALFDALVAYQREINAQYPFSEDVRITLPTDEPIALCLMSDWHIGSEGCDLPRLKADIDLVCSHPRLYVGLGGDVIDNFIIEKMASAARSQVAQVQVQWRVFRYLMQPLLTSKSLLWVSSGNHDQWTERAAGIDGILAALRGVPVCYTGEGGYVDFTVGEQTYTIWRKHKPTRFNSSFNRTHFLKQILRIELPREFDIGISEHLHDAEIDLWTYRKLDRVLVCTGSYKVRDRWSESIGYYGGGYGVPTIVLYPNTRKMIACRSIADALEVLDGASFPAAS